MSLAMGSFFGGVLMSGGEAIHAAVGSAACEEGGTSVCLRALLQEAHSHMDECEGVEAEGGEGRRGWVLQGQVWSREGGGQGQVGACVRPGGGITEGEGGQGEEGDEAGDPAWAAPGDPESGRVRTRAAVEELLDDVPRGLLSVEQAAVLLQWDIFRCDMPCYATGMQEGKRRRLDSECIEDEQGGSDGVT